MKTHRQLSYGRQLYASLSPTALCLSSVHRLLYPLSLSLSSPVQDPILPSQITPAFPSLSVLYVPLVLYLSSHSQKKPYSHQQQLQLQLYPPITLTTHSIAPNKYAQIA